MNQPTEIHNQVFEDDVKKSQALAVATNGITRDQLSLSEKVGALKAFEFTKKLLTVSTIKMLAEIKESQEYKGLKTLSQDGKLLTVSSWEDFCDSLGVSRQKVDLDIQNLTTFGEEFLETSQRMQLGYRDLRKLRKLPDEDREVIINGEAVKAEDKDSLIELIEDMSVKHAKQKATLETKVKELEKENKAKDAVIRQKQETIDTKNDEIIKMDEKLALKLTAPDHERATDFAVELGKLSVEALTMMGKFTALFEQITNDPEVMALLRINMGHALLELKDQADNLIVHHGLDDVSLVDDGFDWIAEANEAIEQQKAERTPEQDTEDFLAFKARMVAEQGLDPDFNLVGQTPEELEAMNK